MSTGDILDWVERNLGIQEAARSLGNHQASSTRVRVVEQGSPSTPVPKSPTAKRPPSPPRPASNPTSPRATSGEKGMAKPEQRGQWWEQKEPPKCGICGRFGHIDRRCWHRPGATPPPGKGGVRAVAQAPPQPTYNPPQMPYYHPPCHNIFRHTHP